MFSPDFKAPRILGVDDWAWRRVQPFLNEEEEAVIIAFRRHTLLALDDCLYALQPTIPHLTGSSLHRCLQRHGISRLPDGSGKTTKAWLWAYARDDRPFAGTSPPMVAYRFEDSRGADCVARHLAGFGGILQVDGYSAYTSLAKARTKTGSNETIQLAGCWAHLRRKFYDLHISGVSQTATASIITMAELWKVEDEVPVSPLR